jgi:archaellum component FlaG (FlaF/FlaG flagellin family)
MGFSLAGAHVIFFVSAVIVAGAVSGVFIAVSNNLIGSFSEKGHHIQEEFETEFAIINDPAAIPLKNNSYIFYIKNIGSRNIITSNSTFQLFIDGDIVSPHFYSFDTEAVYAGKYSSMFVNQTVIGTGYHTLRLIGPLTTEDTFQFKI